MIMEMMVRCAVPPAVAVLQPVEDGGCRKACQPQGDANNLLCSYAAVSNTLQLSCWQNVVLLLLQHESIGSPGLRHAASSLKRREA